MAEFEFLTGTLYVGEQIDDERLENDRDDLYKSALFETDNFNILFKTKMGHYPVKESHINDNNNPSIYYPHQNEVAATVRLGDIPDGFSVKEENIALKYTTIDKEIYICSQCEITAYGGIYVIVNEQVYKIGNSLLFKPKEPVERDEFLDIDPVQTPVPVTNVETGFSKPLNYEHVSELVESNGSNGALKLNYSDDYLLKWFF